MSKDGLDTSITSPEGQFEFPPISLDGVELPKRRFTLTPQFSLSSHKVTQIWQSLHGTHITRILLLVDRQGSMTPLHRFVEEVCAAIKDSGNLANVTEYYFHDVPAEGADESVLQSLPNNDLLPALDAVLPDIKPLTEGFLYEDADLLSPQALDKVLERHANQAAVVLISDAGAARGQYDTLRLLDSIAFLKALHSYTTRYIWLNPLPPKYWTNSTAAQIARHVPMFPLDKAGMYQAVNILREQPYLNLIERPI